MSHEWAIDRWPFPISAIITTVKSFLIITAPPALWDSRGIRTMETILTGKAAILRLGYLPFDVADIHWFYVENIHHFNNDDIHHFCS